MGPPDEQKNAKEKKGESFLTAAKKEGASLLKRPTGPSSRGMRRVKKKTHQTDRGHTARKEPRERGVQTD